MKTILGIARSDTVNSSSIILALSAASLPALTGCTGDGAARVTAPPLADISSLPTDLVPYVSLDHPAFAQSGANQSAIPDFSTNNVDIRGSTVALSCEGGCTFPFFLTSQGIECEIVVSDLSGQAFRKAMACIDTGGLFELSLTTSTIDPQEVWIPEGSTPVAVSTAFGAAHEFRGVIRSLEIAGREGSLLCSPIEVSVIPADRDDPPLLGLIPLSGFEAVQFDWDAGQLRSLDSSDLAHLSQNSEWSSIAWSLQVAKSASSGGQEDLRQGSGRALKRLPTVEVTCAEHTYQAVLDTGCNVPLVVHDAKLLETIDGHAWAEGHQTGRSAVQYGRLKHDLHLGPRTITAGTTTVYVAPIDPQEISEVLIGLPALATDSIVLDFAHHRVHLRRSSSLAQKE